MKRILTLLAEALVMAAMMALAVSTAFADQKAPPNGNPPAVKCNKTPCGG